MTVGEYLLASRAAHVRYRISLTTWDRDRKVWIARSPDVEALMEAFACRAFADDADPQHVDPSWALDTAPSDAILSHFNVKATQATTVEAKAVTVLDAPTVGTLASPEKVH